jgi:hypothetical protein
MNTGIQDAYNLAWKLALVLKHSAHERILDTYNEERLPNAKRLTATTDRMFNLAAGKDWFVGLIRTTIFPPMAKYILGIEAVRKKFFILISQIGIRYRDSSLSAHEGDDAFEVKAGDRMPYFLVDGKSIYDQLRAPRFHLINFSSEVGNQLTQIGSYADLIDQHVVPLNADVVEIFGTNKSFNVLLRPDNYIAFISADTSSRLVTDYFSEIFE